MNMEVDEQGEATHQYEPVVNMEVDEQGEAIHQYVVGQDILQSNDAQVQPMDVESPSKLSSRNSIKV